jgi:hypothetical protein
VHKSISQFGTLCLSADYGTRFDDYIAVNASYLIQNANHLELKTNLIGLMKVTGERKTTSNVKKLAIIVSWKNLTLDFGTCKKSHYDDSGRK